MKTSLKVIAASLVLIAGQAQADNINVGGVVWNPDSLFDFTSTDQMFESSATNIGDTVTGFGRITTLNGDLATTFCPGCELTYTFGGYTLADNADNRFTFTGGWLNVYVDHTPDFSGTNAASAGDGDLWLSLLPHVYYDSFSGRIGSLHSDPTPTMSGVQGSGRGFFDVIDGVGLAFGNFNTDTILVDEDGQGLLGLADFSFTSSFQLLPTPFDSGGVTYTLFGSNDLQGDSIPEPGSLALLGLGLAGLGYVSRRRKA